MTDYEKAYRDLRAGVEALRAEMVGLTAAGASLVGRGWIVHRCDQMLSALEEALLGGGGSRKDRVNALARLLMEAWENAEGKPVNPSYVATFADMARAVLAADARIRRALLAPAPASETAREEPQPVRPYAPSTPLVIISEAEWDEAREAFSDVPELQDAVANANAYAERMPDRIADFLLSYSGDGDTTQPWQDGHNYAMREAARMVRERWFDLGPVAGEPHWKPDGSNGETTMCECPKGSDHD